MAEMIGRYEIRGEIGRGGMATVVKGYDPQFDREVAIKILPRELLHNQMFRARFEREARVVANLEHPAIVPVYDFGEQEGQPYLVMRLMSGGSLRDRMDERGKFTIAEIVEIFDVLAPALDYAHQQGIVHRDLKPGNILFDQHGRPYLSDFGIAKLAEAGATLTGDSTIGTPAYMSPEQVRGDPDLDGRSDLYSLGIILFEMLTGRLPFEANSPTGQMMKHLTAPVPDVRDIDESLSPDVQWVIERILAKSRDERFESAQALVDELRSILRSGHVTGAFAALSTKKPPASVRRTPASTPSSLPSSPMRGKFPVWGWVVPVVVLVGFGAFWGVQKAVSGRLETPVVPTAHPAVVAAASPTVLSPPSVTPTSAPSPMPTATEMAVAVDSPASPTPVPLSPTPEPSPTPSGPVIGGADKLAFVSNNDIWVMNLDGSDAEQLTSTGGSKEQLQWSPDGQDVFYITGRCVLAVNVETKAERTIFCANWSDYLGDFEISPDGSQVVITLKDGFFILPYDLSAISQITTKQRLTAADKCISYTDAPAKEAAWSRDGKQLAVVTVATQSGRQVDLAQVFDVSRCGAPPIRVDSFPGERFTMNNYSRNPTLVDFAWNGNDLFALAVNTLNNFGEIYIYNATEKKAEIKRPVGRCCYRGFEWSPDGNYFMLAFQDSRYGQGAQLYYFIYGTIDAGGNFKPIPLPAGVLTNARENPQPALRPYKP